MQIDQDRPTAVPVRAKVIRIGNSLGVRLPASLHLQLGSEVEVLIRQVDAWPEGYADLDPVGPDFQVPPRETGRDHEKRIKRLFGSRGGF